jgi:hypothetical protein
MAGLGRVQQMFNRAVLGTLATLIGFARGGREEAKRLQGNGGHGHPLLAKYLKSSNPNANTPWTEYPGYCAGAQETERRRLRNSYADIMKDAA